MPVRFLVTVENSCKLGFLYHVFFLPCFLGACKYLFIEIKRGDCFVSNHKKSDQILFSLFVFLFFGLKNIMFDIERSGFYRAQ